MAKKNLKKEEMSKVNGGFVAAKDSTEEKNSAGAQIDLAGHPWKGIPTREGTAGVRAKLAPLFEYFYHFYKVHGKKEK